MMRNRTSDAGETHADSSAAARRPALRRRLLAQLSASLMGAAGLSALMLGSAAADPLYEGTCGLDGTVVTCTGNEAADGVNVGDEVTHLHIRDVTSDIVPTYGVGGVVMDSGTGGVAAVVNLGTHAIRASGEGADGVYVSAYGDQSSASLALTGDVESSHGRGVVVSGSGTVASSTNGNIASLSDALTGHSWGDSVTLEHTGDLTAWGGTGVVVDGLGSSVTVDGNITASGDGIYSHSYSNSDGTTVTQTGLIEAWNGTGILIEDANGGATINSTGDISAKIDGINVAASGDIDITQDGTLTASTGTGIAADSSNGAVSIARTGGVSSGLNGVVARSHGFNGSVMIDSQGNIDAGTGSGVVAEAGDGPVSITLDGNTTAKNDAIWAKANGTSSGTGVDIDSKGDVTSYAGLGIYAETSGPGMTDGSASFGVRVVQNGNLVAKLDGITALSTGSGNSRVLVGISGDLLSYDGRGIVAQSDNGKVGVLTVGSVTSKSDAVYARSYAATAADGAVNIATKGNITSYDGGGIDAESASGGVVVASSGKITAQNDAIRAVTSGNGTAAVVNIKNVGDIVSYSGRGIDGEAANKFVKVDNSGSITSQLAGIVVASTGAGATSYVEVKQRGNILSWAGAGIDASSTGGPVTIDAVGGIDADLDAIRAASEGDDHVATVAVTNDGSLVSHHGSGIVASSTREGVTVTNNGSITADLNGISAVGTGNTGTSGVTVQQTGNITVAKGSGIVASSAGEGVTVTNNGSIIADVDGISAVSTGNTGTSGVTVQQTGNITVAKGSGILALATGADVTVTQSGNITGGEFGIHATSQSRTATADIGAGSVISGSSDAGVYLSSITGATLTNHGDISSKYGLAFKIDGPGAGVVDNYGTISGNFAFDAGEGSFNNMHGATYKAGTAMDFAGGGVFNNGGLLSLTADPALQNTFLSGDYVQGSTGKLLADIRFSDKSSDRLVVSGTASLAGKVGIAFDSFDGGLVKDFTLLTASEGLTLGDVKFANIAVKGVVVAENGTDAVLKISGVDFTPDNLNRSRRSAGSYVENVFNAGMPSALKPLFTELLNIDDIDAYDAAFAQLSPDQYSDEVISSYGANLSFANRMLSCRVADGPNRFKAEGDCDWAGARGSVFQQDRTADSDAFNQTFATLEAGAQRRLDATWRLGGSIALTNSQLAAANGSTVSGTQGQAGMVVKYDTDALLLAAALTGGYGVNHNTRNVDIGMISDTLEGDAPVAYLSARVHTAYTVDLGAAYIKPLFNLDLTATRFGGVTETGGATALTIDPGLQYAAHFNPAIEIGGEFVAGDGTLIRPFAQVGLEASLASDLDLAAHFSGVDPSVGSFAIHQATGEPVAKLLLGADILTSDDATVRAYYEGAFGAHSRKNGVGLKMSGTFN
jgi:hypothetical protein